MSGGQAEVGMGIVWLGSFLTITHVCPLITIALGLGVTGSKIG